MSFSSEGITFIKLVTFLESFSSFQLPRPRTHPGEIIPLPPILQHPSPSPLPCPAAVDPKTDRARHLLPHSLAFRGKKRNVIQKRNKLMRKNEFMSQMELCRRFPNY